jgi:hypothetical protein
MVFAGFSRPFTHKKKLRGQQTNGNEESSQSSTTHSSKRNNESISIEHNMETGGEDDDASKTDRVVRSLSEWSFVLRDCLLSLLLSMFWY